MSEVEGRSGRDRLIRMQGAFRDVRGELAAGRFAGAADEIVAKGRTLAVSRAVPFDMPFRRPKYVASSSTRIFL